ncbi:MAG: RNA polymerase sigma factor [Gaiellaceae bacterium]
MTVTAVEHPDFSQAAREHLRAVHAYLVYLIGDRSTAEDLTATTFEKALRNWRRFDPRRGSARTWLCAIARGVALDHFRSEDRRRRREDAYALRQEFEVPEPGFGEGLSPELEAGLAALSAGEREVIALRILLELDAETTARLLGISRSACSMRLSRALEKLQERVTSDVEA